MGAEPLMAGNSQRRGRSDGAGKKRATAGTGGKNRRSLAGRGATPPAEARPGHPAQRRAAAPALVRQADAVMPTARRCGTTTPWASNAAAERTTAPRLRGSVTPSSATTSGGRPELRATSSRSSGWA